MIELGRDAGTGGSGFAPGSGGAGRRYLEFEGRPTAGRLAVELLFYVSVIGREFAGILGLLSVEGLSGAIVVVCTAVCLPLILQSRERIPISVYFSLGINVLANTNHLVFLHEMPIFGEGLRPLLFWLCELLMACYVVRNGAAARRMLFVLGGMVVMATAVGSSSTSGGHGFDRLELEGVGTGFANANTLAYLSGLLGVTALFYSATARKKYKLFYWPLALVLLFVMVQTVSRGGLVAVVFGLMLYGCSILFGRGGKIGLVVVAVLGMAGASRVAYDLANTRAAFEHRAHLHSSRVDTWLAIADDLPSTLVAGRGASRGAVSKTGVTAHNTFFYTHIVFGGPSAWLYACWMVVLFRRGWRFLRSSEAALGLKCEVLAIFGMAFACQMMSNFGPLHYSVIYAIAITEKYTCHYTSAEMARRQGVASLARVDRGPSRGYA